MKGIIKIIIIADECEKHETISLILLSFFLLLQLYISSVLSHWALCKSLCQVYKVLGLEVFYESRKFCLGWDWGDVVC